MTFEKILPQLIKLTADVGKVIMSFYKADMAVEMKLNLVVKTIIMGLSKGRIYQSKNCLMVFNIGNTNTKFPSLF
jgi:hypothetical protein